MLLALLSVLAVAKPAIETKGELPVGPLISWTVPSEDGSKVRIRAVYEKDSKNRTLLKSSDSLHIVSRAGRNSLIVVEHSEPRALWRVDFQANKVESFTEGEPAAAPADTREKCGDQWPPKGAGTWSLYLDPDDADKLASVKAFGFRSYYPKKMAESGEPVKKKAVGLVADLGDEQLIALDGEPHVLYGVKKDGTTRKVAELHEDEFALLSAVEASPNGELLAVGAYNRNTWFKRRLVVLNAATGEVVLEREDIDLTTGVRSGEPPIMKLAWASDDKLQFSDTDPEAGMRWIEVSVPAGEETMNHPYTSLPGVRHRTPPGAGCVAVYAEGGHVRSAETGGIVLAGSYKPEDCVMSVDGRLGACRDEEWIWIVDGDAREGKSITRSQIENLKWLQ